MRNGLIGLIEKTLLKIQITNEFLRGDLASIRYDLGQLIKVMESEPQMDEAFYKQSVLKIKNQITEMHTEYKNNESLTEDQKKTLSQLTAALDPINSLYENLEAGKKFDEANNDFSFLMSYFGPQLNFNNPENYVPGQKKFDDGDLQRAANEYKEALEHYKSNVMQNIGSLAKDNINPEETLKAKLEVLQSAGFGFLGEENTKRKLNRQAPLRNPMTDIFDGYKHLVDTLDPKKIQNMSNGYIQSEEFFATTMGHIFDSTYFEGQIEKELKDFINPEMAKMIKTAVKPLRISRTVDKKIVNGKEVGKTVYTGMTDQIMETLEQSSKLMQMLYQCEYSLSHEYPDQVKPNGPLYQVNNALNTYNNKIVAYLKGDQDAQAPTKEDMEAVVNTIGDTLLKFDTNNRTRDDSTALFNKNGMTESASILLGTLKTVGEVCPYYLPVTHKYFNNIKERVLIARNEKKQMAFSRVPETEGDFQQMDNFFKGFMDMYTNGFITQDDYYQDMMTEMATSPAYNEHVNRILREEIQIMAQSEARDEKYSPQHYIVVNDKDKEALDLPMEEKTLPIEKIRSSMYKMFLTSQLIRREHQKLAKLNNSKATFENKVKGHANPLIQTLTKAPKITEEILHNTTQFFDGILSSKSFEALGFVTASEMNNAIENANLIEDLVKTGANRQAEALDNATVEQNQVEVSHKKALTEENEVLSAMNEFYIGMDAKTIDALSQNSGILGKSNSKEYTAIGDAIARINTNKQAGIGVSKNDYMALLNACTHYVYTHSSDPSTGTGKDRFNAAAKIAANLSYQMQKLSKNSPNQLEQLQEDAKINMIRSKVFRDAYVASAKNDLLKTIPEVNHGSITDAQKFSIDNANKTLLHAEIISRELPNSEVNKLFSKKIENGKDFDNFMKNAKPQMEKLDRIMQNPDADRMEVAMAFASNVSPVQHLENKYPKPEPEAPQVEAPVVQGPGLH